MLAGGYPEKSFLVAAEQALAAELEVVFDSAAVAAVSSRLFPDGIAYSPSPPASAGATRG